MEKANIVIIGGGAVGLSVAASLSKVTDGILLLEKNRRLGQEASSHNSGVVHSGIHYPHGSLKAKLCLRGNVLLYNMCEKFHITCKRLGKLTIAVSELEIRELEKIMRNGEENGVEGLKLLDSNEIRILEPNIKAALALYSPSTGIIEPGELLDHYVSVARNNEGIIVSETEVTGIDKTDKGYLVKGISKGERFAIVSNTVINCAGLYSDMVASMVGLNIDALGYKQKFQKGDYFRIVGNPPIRMPIYPLPQGDWLGIHLTPDMAGSVKLGPNSYGVNKIDYTVESSESEFRKSVSSFLPAIERAVINVDSSGIRAQLAKKQNDFGDFIVRHEKDRDLFGFINLIGIDSPGLTASPAIGEFVAELYLNEIK